jgi:hypothetical protein
MVYAVRIGTYIHTPGERVRTYNFIVSAAGVVRPRGRLHDLPSYSFKVEQVVALRERRHVLDALLALQFERILDLLVVLDSRHVDVAEVLGDIEVLVQRVRGVDGLECLGGVFAGVFQDDFLAAGVFFVLAQPFCIALHRISQRTWQEFGDIICLAVHNDPARVLAVVLGDLLAGELCHCDVNSYKGETERLLYRRGRHGLCRESRMISRRE